MKLSTRARYGVRMMLVLARNYGEGTIYLKEIAKSEEISEKYLSQIIIPLKWVGLVKSIRGAHGGYALAKSPSNITLNLKTAVGRHHPGTGIRSGAGSSGKYGSNFL